MNELLKIMVLNVAPVVFVIVACVWIERARVTWKKQLSFVFSDGYEYTTGLDFVLPAFECSVNLPGRQLTHIILHDAVGKILPLLSSIECRGQKYAYTTELGLNKSVILRLQTPIDVSSLAGRQVRAVHVRSAGENNPDQPLTRAVPHPPTLRPYGPRVFFVLF